MFKKASSQKELQCNNIKKTECVVVCTVFLNLNSSNEKCFISCLLLSIKVINIRKLVEYIVRLTTIN